MWQMYRHMIYLHAAFFSKGRVFCLIKKAFMQLNHGFKKYTTVYLGSTHSLDSPSYFFLFIFYGDVIKPIFQMIYIFNCKHDSSWINYIFNSLSPGAHYHLIIHNFWNILNSRYNYIREQCPFPNAPYDPPLIANSTSLLRLILREKRIGQTSTRLISSVTLFFINSFMIWTGR